MRRVRLAVKALQNLFIANRRQNLADLVILDQDPLKVEPMAIKDIKVVETIKEGRTIYPF